MVVCVIFAFPFALLLLPTEVLEWIMLEWGCPEVSFIMELGSFLVRLRVFDRVRILDSWKEDFEPTFSLFTIKRLEVSNLLSLN